MPDRILNALLALVGLLVVAAIVLLGCNVQRAAESGPRWRRRLVGAGLSLLALFGVAPAASAAEAPSKLVAGDSKPLADSPEWKALHATWREASEIASGKRGPYPFDAAGKERLLAALGKVAQGADALRGRALLSDAEAGLVKIELANLTSGVNEKRPTEERMATCYEPLPLCYAAMQSVERLAARLPLLGNLAASQRIQPAVASKVLAAVEADLAMLADPKQVARYPAEGKPKMDETRKAAAALAAKLKAALGE